MIKVLGIDFDGTLADTDNAVSHCLRELARKDSIIAYKKLERLSHPIKGKALKEQLSFFIHELSMNDAISIFMKIYGEEGIQQTRLKPGALELLSYCDKRLISTIVISAKSNINLTKCLEFVGLSHLEHYGSLDFEGKVNEMKKNNIDIYIGDQKSDVEASLKAGVKPILIQEGNVTPDQKLDGLKVVRNLSEFTIYLDEL